MADAARLEAVRAWWKKDQCVYSQKELAKTISAKPLSIRAPYHDKIIETLVADGDVLFDKVGAHKVYWWNREKYSVASLKQQWGSVKEALSTAEQKLAKKREENKASQATSGEAQFSEEEYSDLQKQLAALKAELQELREKDPEKLQKLQNLLENLKSGSERWEQNLDTLNGILGQFQQQAGRECAERPVEMYETKEMYD